MSRIQKTAYLSASQVITTLSTLAVAVTLSRVLETKAEYGTYQQTLLVYTFIAPLLALGLPAATFYFVPRNQGKERSILINGLTALITSALLFALFCATLGPIFIPSWFGNSDLVRTIPWLAIYGPATLILIFISSALVAVGRPKTSALFTAIFRLFMAFSVVLSAVIYASVNISLGVQAVVCLAGAILGIGVIWHSTSKNKSGPLLPSLSGVSTQLKYAVPLGLGAMLEGMALAIDKVIVSLFCSTEEYAVFVNGAMEVPLIAAITVAAGAVMLPEIVTAFSKNDRSKALGLWKLMVKRVALFLLPAGFLFYLVSEELMVVLYSESFKASADPFRIYMLMLPARVAYFGMLFQGAGKTHLVLLRAIITLFLNTMITYFLVRKFGMSGAAWGTVAVVWFFVVPYCVIQCSKFVEARWNVLLPYRYILAVGTVSAVAALGAWYLSGLFEIRSALFAGMLKGFIYTIVVSVLMGVFFREDCLHIYKQLKSRLR
ncbi:polysaccharide biosynthesis C-terminal domain-containing protein [Verrucomicrobiales bacterium]|nr:polysaccharide biosynthesis C-terminal domain-containing protein [Verrucomicrobiales bacterium]MDB4720943.1 polysaccharide biosynthesis C-terminal domain-containing protein [Verrucomicrobiales bacterium]|tara:strand:- start:156 stop:1628 length:1473 start_codon:yes stop_codon:yes gene_type:complete